MHLMTCERCGEKFEGANARQLIHCRKCAERLRRQGLGPIQLRRRPEVQPFLNNQQRLVEVCREIIRRDDLNSRPF